MRAKTVFFTIIFLSFGLALPAVAGGRKADSPALAERDPYLTKPEPKHAFLPPEVQCEHASDCQAIQGVCQGWEFVHQYYAQERANLNRIRRERQDCVVDADTMGKPPTPACFLHTCVDAAAVQAKGKNCEDRKKYVDYFHGLARSCQTDTDCARGLAHCGFGCVPILFHRDAATFLNKWISTYADACENCTEVCIDRYADAMPAHMIRCRLGRCILEPKRQIQIGQ